MPAARLRSTSSSTSASVGVGPQRRTLGPARRTSTSERSSSRASLLAALIAPSALSASSGRSWIRWSAVPACTLMSDRLWATTSWSSRAMRSCSSRARSRVLLLARRAGRRRALAPDADDLGRGREHEQPRREPEGGGPATARRPCRTSGGSHRNVTQPTGDGHPRHHAVAGEQRGAERDDQREVHRPLRVAEHRVRERRRVRDEQEHGDRVRAPATPAGGAGHEQERAADAEVEPGVLVRTGERRADDLDDRDRARDREVASGRRAHPRDGRRRRPRGVLPNGLTIETTVASARTTQWAIAGSRKPPEPPRARSCAPGAITRKSVTTSGMNAISLSTTHQWRGDAPRRARGRARGR